MASRLFVGQEQTRPMLSTTLSSTSSTSDTDPLLVTTAAASSPRTRPHASSLSHSSYGSTGSFPSAPRDGHERKGEPMPPWRVSLIQLAANIISTFFLLLIVLWALVSTLTANTWETIINRRRRKRERRTWDTDLSRLKYAHESVTKDLHYYANACGFELVEHVVKTEDGYLLKVYKVFSVAKKAARGVTRKGFPVLIKHGLFQSAGSFITCEERSLAFWLAENGDYEVYLGQGRGVGGMGHVSLDRGDPRFWDYNIKELAKYDLPALVDHVCRDSGQDRLAFIGHSQGNATMFCSLAQDIVPELGDKLSVFIALAPAVYAGPLTTGITFSILKSMRWSTWSRIFGVLDFIPAMRVAYDWTPGVIFGRLGYIMFAWLFEWSDRNWLLRRKAKKFRFMPSPVSSASLFWWTGHQGFSTTGCVLDPNIPRWFDKRFPPLSIYYGSADRLVLTEPLLQRLEERETDVNVIRVSRMEDGEHCDAFWHIDAVELCFYDIMEDIESTRPQSDYRWSAGSDSGISPKRTRETLIEV